MGPQDRKWLFDYVCIKSRGQSVFERLRDVEQLEVEFPYDISLKQTVLSDLIYDSNQFLVLARSGIYRVPLSRRLEQLTPPNQREHTPLTFVKNGHLPEELGKLRGDLAQVLGQSSFSMMRDRARYVDKVIEEVFPLED
ncbi:MAG: hypothetical protein Q8P81_01970 [Nanoarchaeota archaeon]|nr:hypothetical protein [Nanoarchaeota archaeon]